MPELVKAKLRRIGSSVGVLIPQENIKALGVGVGDEIEVALLRHRSKREIELMFGIAKKAEPFVRDKTTREFSC